MPSLSDLLQKQTKADLQAKLGQLLQLAGAPVQSWHLFSILRHFFEEEPELLVDLGTAISSIAAGGFVRLAPDGWVDLVASEFFDEVRKPATFTEGPITLKDSAGTGPHTITVGGLWVADATKSKRFVCTALPNGGTLPLGGTLVVTVRAESAGSAYNVAPGLISQLLTTFPGVTVSNPATLSGTWVTTVGVDLEEKEQLAARCIAKWSTLGAGCDADAYFYNATAASDEVRRVRSTSPGGGSVRNVIASQGAPVSAAALAAVRARIEAKRPLGVPDVTVSNAVLRTETVSGSLQFRAGVDAAVGLAKAQAGAEAFSRTVELGGRMSRELLIAALKVDGLTDMEITTPATDLQLLSEEVLAFTFALTAAASA